MRAEAVAEDVGAEAEGAAEYVGTEVEGAAEHAEASGEGEAAGRKCATVQIFRETISLRDDWLHRGEALQDLDLQTYAEHVQREEKPMRGVDLRKTLRMQVFAFDAHYKLAARYVQALKPGSRRCIARFNVPNCLRENVNEGEENAMFKAFHCSLLRCPGKDQCADPLLCAPVLFPGKDGKFRFRPAWRARESEILTLARRGHAKKVRARRLETLHDTTLCKACASARDGSNKAGAAEHAGSHKGGHDGSGDEGLVPTILQLDLQRLFRQRIRRLREQASAENPCAFGYYERVVHSILGCVGAPLWHDDQLHVAEWQALQQFDFLVNLTSSVDGKSVALDKLKIHKESAAARAEAVEAEPRNPLVSHGGEEFALVGDDDLISSDEPVPGALLPPVTDEGVVLRLLGREQEVALARRPGQGNRESVQYMREVRDAFGTATPLRS